MIPYDISRRRANFQYVRFESGERERGRSGLDKNVKRTVFICIKMKKPPGKAADPVIRVGKADVISGG